MSPSRRNPKRKGWKMPEGNIENPFENVGTIQTTPGPMKKLAKGFFSELDSVEKAVTDIMKAHNEVAVIAVALLKVMVAKGIVTEEDFKTYTEKTQEELGLKPTEKKE
jgi:hypothetical protein